MLNLLALLLLAIPAQSSSAYFENNDNHHEEVGDTCAGRRPTISTTDKTGTFFMHSNLFIDMAYGKDVTVYCAGRKSTVKIRYGDTYLTAEEVNTTAIRYVIQKPNITVNPQYQYEYSCVDNQTNCTSYTLSINVVPAMSVSASRVHLTTDINDERVYFVPHGQSYQVYCSGQDATALMIENISDDFVQAEAINQTTIKHDAQADGTDEVTYWCHTGFGYTSRLALKYELNMVTVGYYPEAQNFQCTLSLYNDKEEFKCTWTALSVNNKFDLFYIDWYGNRHPFCVAAPVRRVTSAINEWNCLYFRYLIRSLLLQSCNRIFCVNETFSEKQAVFIKYDQPANLKLLNKNSHGATISWDLNGYCFSDWSQTCEYRLEYRLLGTDWRQVAAPPLRCINTLYDYKNNCEYEINLKCPSKRYELRLYVRPTHQEPARAVWSKPAYLYLFTDPQDTDEEIDPECNVEYTEQAPPPSVDQVLHEVRLLENYGSKEQLVSRKKLSALKQKHAKIQALAQSLAAQK